MSRDLDQEHVADALSRQTQAALLVEQGVHEHIGMDIALHDRISLALAYELDRFRRNNRIGACRDDPVPRHRPADVLAGCGDQVRVTDEARRDEAERVRVTERLDHDFLRGVRDGDADRYQRLCLINEMLQALNGRSHCLRPLCGGLRRKHLLDVPGDHPLFVGRERLDGNAAGACRDRASAIGVSLVVERDAEIP